MKKLLLFSFMAFAAMSNAQILVSESFENGTFPGFAITGGYTGTAGTYLGSTCDGNIQIGAESYGSSTANSTINLIYTKPASITANGKKIDISFNYTTVPYDASSLIGGTITVAYSKDNGTTYTTVGTPITLTAAAQTCAQFTGTIPESANVNGNFMLRIQTVGSSGTTYDFYNFIDKVSIKQEVTAVPGCATISSPTAGATGASVRQQIAWGAVAGAENYKVKIGTTSGSSNIYNGTTTNTFYTPPSTNAFPANTMLYVSVTPSNALGDATGCSEISFITGANPYAPYCGTLQAKLGVYPISAVAFSNVNNTSSAVVGPAGNGHENFTSSIAIVDKGMSYPITLTGTGVGTNRFAFTVFVDWNQNGSFSDAGESYFVTSDFAGGTGNTVTVNKNIAIPATAALGNTRMRVKFHFNSSTTTVRTELSDPCADLNQGQAEDYTLTVQDAMSTSDLTKKNDISVYPNPFRDVVKISNIKDVKSIVVSDIAGRQVKTLQASSEIDLSDLNAGLYLISLQMEDGTIRTVKAIKK